MWNREKASDGDVGKTTRMTWDSLNVIVADSSAPYLRSYLAWKKMAMPLSTITKLQLLLFKMFAGAAKPRQTHTDALVSHESLLSAPRLVFQLAHGCRLGSGLLCFAVTAAQYPSQCCSVFAPYLWSFIMEIQKHISQWNLAKWQPRNHFSLVILNVSFQCLFRYSKKWRMGE